MLGLLKQATNSVDWSSISKWFNDNQGVTTAIVTLVAAGIVVAATMYYQKKRMKIQGLNLVFQKLNDPKKRDARRNILSTYAIYLRQHNLPTTYTPINFKDLLYDVDMADYYPKIKDDLETVKSDFEEIAVMAKHGMIDKKAYFDAYWGTMMKCFPALYGHIMKSRRLSGSEHFTVYYEKQCYEAIKYWSTYHDCSTLKYYTDVDLGQIDWVPRTDMPPPKKNSKDISHKS